MKTTIISNSRTDLKIFSDHIIKLSDNKPDYFLPDDVNDNLIRSSDLLLISADSYNTAQFQSISKRLDYLHSDTVVLFYGTEISKASLTKLCLVDGFLLLNKKRSLPENDPTDHLWVKIFGKFEVLANGKTINFKNSKSKELLALCIERRGNKISSKDAAELLWSDRMKSSDVSQLYRKAARNLTETLAKEGFDNIFNREYGKCWVNMDRIRCDLFHFITDPKKYISLNGDYLSEYSWAQKTRKMIRLLIEIVENLSDKNPKDFRLIFNSLFLP